MAGKVREFCYRKPAGTLQAVFTLYRYCCLSQAEQ